MKKPAAFFLNFSAAGSIRLGEVVTDTRPADHHTSTLQKTYFFFLAAFFLAFFLVAMVDSFRLWLGNEDGIVPGTAQAAKNCGNSRFSRQRGHHHGARTSPHGGG